MRARWIALVALALAVVLGGCLSWLPSDDEDAPEPAGGAQANATLTQAPAHNDTSDDPNATREANASGEPSNASAEEEPPSTEPPIPANVTMDGAEVASRTDRRVVFSWNGTVTPAEGVGNGRAVANLTMPPGTHLKVQANLSWDDPKLHVVPEVDHREAGWCNNFGALDPRGAVQWRTQTTATSCTLRPDPRPGWERWTIAARYTGSNDVQLLDRDAAFHMQVEMVALQSPFSDLEPAGLEGWPSLEEASIRPGAKIGPSGCTANFVFQSPSKAHVYVGTAAHCFDEHGLGTMLTVAGIPDAGRIVYCSWGAMPNSTGPGCRFPADATTDEGANADDDFTLVEIRPDLHELVHPALLHWGGPIGLATDVADGTRVVGYGNSTTRDASETEVPGPADPTRGYVAGQPHNWSTSVDLLPPGAPGDSGSPVLVGDGRALGVMKTLGASCQRNGNNLLSRSDGLGPINPAANGVSNLAPMLEALHERTNLTVQLATWPLLQQPDFPQSPADPSPAPASCLGGPPPSPSSHAGSGQDT